MSFNEILLLCCFIPALVLIVVGLLIVLNFSRFLRALPVFTAPDTEELHRQYEKLKADHPQDTQQQLIRRIINQYALRQGIVGTLTSVGGFIFLPVGLMVDLVYSAKSNAALSYFIAQTYGIQEEAKSLNVAQLLVLRQRKVSATELLMWQEQFAGGIYQQLMRTVLQKSVVKLVPGLGAFIGFGVNWSSAQLFGRLANEYYSGNINTLIKKGGGQLKK